MTAGKVLGACLLGAAVLPGAAAPPGLRVNVVPVVLAAWHVVQPPVMPVWFITPGLNVVVLLWHSVQAWLVGMWLAGLPPVTPVLNEVVEVWQVPQSPVVG